MRSAIPAALACKAFQRQIRLRLAQFEKRADEPLPRASTAASR